MKAWSGEAFAFVVRFLVAVIGICYFDFSIIRHDNSHLTFGRRKAVAPLMVKSFVVVVVLFFKAMLCFKLRQCLEREIYFLQPSYLSKYLFLDLNYLHQLTDLFFFLNEQIEAIMS